MTKHGGARMSNRRSSLGKWLTALTTAILMISIFVPSAALANQGELEIIVEMGGEDISLEVQVIIMGNMMPTLLEPGQAKTVSLPAGTYDVMAMLAETEAFAIPAQANVTIAAGETKTIHMELQSMAGFAMPGMPDMSEMPAVPGMPGAEQEEPAFDPAEAATDELLTMLHSGGEDERQVAAAELAVAFRRREAAADLVNLLAHSDLAVRQAAMTALVGLGGEQPDGKKIGTRPIDDVMDAIVPYLGDQDLPIRLGAAAIVADAWYFPNHAIPLLVQGLQESAVEMRIAAAKALASWGQKSAEYSPQLMTALTQALQDSEQRVRVLAVEALRWVDHDGGERAAALAPALFDSDSAVRSKAAQVLEGIGAPAVRVSDELLRAARDTEPVVRQYALKTMSHFPADAVAPHVPVLAGHLTDENEYVRTAAAEALWTAGRQVAPALPALSEALLDPSWRVAQAAARIIQQHIAPDAVPAIANLAQLLQRSESSFREAASTAVFALAAIGEPAIPALTELLYKDDHHTLYRAATGLNTIGPAAEAAVPRLEELLYDEGQHDEVRRAAYFALASITGEEPEM